MKIPYTLALLLIAGASQAQGLPKSKKDISFKENGQLATSPDVWEDHSKYSCTDLTLIEWSAKEMSKTRRELAGRFKKTAALLRATKLPQYNYYKWLWDDVTLKELSQQLATMSTTLYSGPLISGKYPQCLPDAPLVLVNSSYKKSLKSTDSLATLDRTLERCFSKDTVLYRITKDSSTDEHILTVRTKSVANDFVLSYFAALDCSVARKSFSNLSRSDMAQLLAAARKQQREATSLLRDSLSILSSSELSKSLTAARRRIQQLGLVSLLRTPWVKQWLWYREGELCLNPLLFTDEALLKTPVNDSARANYLSQYTKRVLNKRLSESKQFNIASYVEDVKFLGKEKTLFTDSTAYKQAVARNRAAALRYQSVGQVINKVRLPHPQNDLVGIGFVNTSYDALARVRALDPITTDTRVVVAAHNMARKHTLKLVRTQATFIKDWSGTQQALDEGLAGFGELTSSTAAVVIKALNATKKDTVFNSRKSKSDKDNFSLIKKLREDNLYLGISIQLADTASLPPHRVKPLLDTDPVWHTELAATTLSDSTKTYVYKLQDVPPKGSTDEPVSFASFSYKTGKRHIIQFSAGLAYSFRPVRTTELNTTGGQLTYSTTDTRFRVFAGVNIYPLRKGVFLQDKTFTGLRTGNPRNFQSRLNVQLAVGIPRPLDNVYLGLGYDLGPGIRLNSGVHLHGYTAYEVANNRVLTQGTTYDAVPYLAVGIDPVTFVKSLVFFK